MKILIMRIMIPGLFASLLIGPGAILAQVAPSAPAPAWSISAEALSWWFKASPAPAPLVTDGLVGQPATHVFLGGRDLDTNPNPGLRLTAGYMVTERRGWEGSVFYMPPRSTSRSVSSSGQPGSTDLFMPYFDVTRPGESAFKLSSQGAFAGSAKEELESSLLGAELNGTVRLTGAGPWRVDLLGGFRYLRLRETYTFATDTPNISPQPADVYRTQDSFESTNNFYGPQLGVRARAQWQSLVVTGAVKVALGAMVQSVDIDGWTKTNDFNDFGPVQTFNGGYYALPTNIGSYSRTAFGVVPEAAFTVGYQFSPRVSVLAGYTFLYESSVIRAPQSINRNINPTGINALVPKSPPGPLEPSFTSHTSELWAQGLNVGLTIHF
jgi:hypothetical protein